MGTYFNEMRLNFHSLYLELYNKNIISIFRKVSSIRENDRYHYLTSHNIS